MKFFLEDQWFELLDSKVSSYLPRFVMNGMLIAVGNVETYESIHLDNTVYGSKRYLDNDADVLVFDDEKRLFKYMELSVPFNIQVVQDEFSVVSGIGCNVLKKISHDSFWADKTSYAKYFSGSDSIVISYKPIKQLLDRAVKFQLFEDLYIVLNNNQLVGWEISNCSSYLFDSDSKSFDRPDEQIKDVLISFLRLYNETSFIQMSNRDIRFKQKLERLIEQCDKVKASSIKAVIIIWLDDYYW